MNHRNLMTRSLVLAGLALYTVLGAQSATATTLNLRNVPVFLDDAVAPLNMLVMGRDHKLYYEAYNDASDLDDDGQLDVGFRPNITYYGYFDPAKCYTYGSSRFSPIGAAGPANTCTGAWSGNWLNYVTTARIDALRKVLYGGRRSTDTTTETILERTHIPQDAHSWGKQYTSPAVDGYDISQYAPLAVPVAGRRHLFANTTLLTDASQLPLMRVLQNVQAEVSDWVSIERPVADNRVVNSVVGTLTVTPTDFVVRVRVCVAGMLEPNCRLYPNGQHKPIGLLQDFGETNSMMFGLITGSYQRNTDGGVLRKRMGTITDEIDPTTGVFTDVNPGIIRTLNNLRTVGFGGYYEYTDPADNCGWITTGPITSGRCRMWGNPIAEMMYESLRYFAGRNAPTAAFDIANTGNPDAALGLSRATWNNPYAAGQPSCARPFQTVISDINPSYDTDQLPGSSFASFSGDLSGLNVSSLGSTIWTNEFGGPREHFIGQSGALYDGAPTPKIVSSFANIRGLAPEEPTKLGGYYAASVAYHGLMTDMNSAAGQQRVQTFAVALASPLPRIEIPVAGRRITLVPFAKSVGGCLGVVGTQGQFQPTNQIVDFYVESITPTSGSFRVNFEDVEQGADHDMDAIVRYTYQVNADDTVTVRMQSLYAAGCIIQHMGYVISGTTRDGTYLEVRDLDTGAGSDPDYFLDTPPSPLGPPPMVPPAWNDGAPLPLTSERRFAPGAASGATLLRDPLWFAAKWGGFRDADNNGVPNLAGEWDGDGDGDPDNYFLVTNALTLGDQLTRAFNEVLARTSSSSVAAVNSGTLREDSVLYQAEFNPRAWSGNVVARQLNLDGSIGGVLWNAATMLPAPTARRIATVNTSGSAVPFNFASLDGGRRAEIGPENVTATTQARIDYVRGDRSRERRNNGPFRNREPLSALGDFVSSAPVFVGRPPFRYRNNLESVPYFSFREANSNRRKMLYVGGNDGMLHAFDADTGVEQWAFIPSRAWPALLPYSQPNYVHRYSVDGTPTMGDAFWGGSWRTVLLTPLGQGGQEIFAMDVTNPEASTEAQVASKYMWSFTDQQDVDLGFTFSRPSIVKMRDGRWAAIFGNGYNNTQPDGRASTTGNAVLYVVDISTGSLIRKIDTRVGTTQDPRLPQRANGLATPTVVDVDRDGIADYAYAGDLFGNLWKFSFTSSNPSDWNSAYLDASSNPVPFYVARNGSAQRQPITIRPQVAPGPGGRGIWVYFGTGKFLELADRTVATLQVQTLYGLIDRNVGNAVSDVIPGRAALRQQTIVYEQLAQTFGTRSEDVRVVSNNPLAGQRGWFLDLISPLSGFQGEMQVTDAVLRDEVLVLTTLVPNTDICGFGGDSWVMLLNPATGGQLAATFDLDGNGTFGPEDTIDLDGDPSTNDRVAASGRRAGVGIASAPRVVAGDGFNMVYTSGTGEAGGGSGGGAGFAPPDTVSAAAFNQSAGAFGRQSWRQLR